ncbi:MAG: hypothetical protein IPJ40_15215 [Saprospirales bacterium]|nr:hypothetical protein [Saprospirales bacterium]
MRRFLFHILLTIMLLLTGISGPVASHAQVGARATIDSTEMLVGGKRTVRLRVDFAPGVLILEPGIIAIDTSGTLELLRTSAWDTTRVSDKAITLEKDLLLTAWDSGCYAISPIMVPYEIQGRTDTIYTNAVSFRVNRFPGFHRPDALKPIIENPFGWKALSPISSGCCHSRHSDSPVAMATKRLPRCRGESTSCWSFHLTPYREIRNAEASPTLAKRAVQRVSHPTDLYSARIPGKPLWHSGSGKHFQRNRYAIKKPDSRRPSHQ